MAYLKLSTMTVSVASELPEWCQVFFSDWGAQITDVTASSFSLIKKQYHTCFSLFLFICQYTLLSWQKLTCLWCEWITGFSEINSCCETSWVSVQEQVERVAEVPGVLFFLIKCLLWMEFGERMFEKSNKGFITERKTMWRQFLT